jgi:hypothetical protein
MFDTGTFDSSTFDLGAALLFPPSIDTHSGDWIPKHKPHRRAPVYSQEYYDSLTEKRRGDLPLPLAVPDIVENFVEEIKEKERAPNLLIPLSDLIDSIELPSFGRPPSELVAELITEEISVVSKLIADEISKENETIRAMLVAEMERDDLEFQIQKAEYDRLLRAVKGRPQIKEVMASLSDAIDKIHKSTQSKKRVVYGYDGRPKFIEAIDEGILS